MVKTTGGGRLFRLGRRNPHGGYLGRGIQPRRALDIARFHSLTSASSPSSGGLLILNFDRRQLLAEMPVQPTQKR
jgi:hypothetical protein